MRSDPVSVAQRSRGFTLVEVLVALFIVGMSMAALLGTLAQAAKNSEIMRDKTFAQWIALNQIATMRLQGGNVVAGKTKGEVEFAGQKWRWRQEIQDSGISSLMRIDVGVQLAATPVSDSADVRDGAEGSATGFIGRALGTANGSFPDWGGGAIQNPPPSGQTPAPTPAT